jgi:hypothetical protein
MDLGSDGDPRLTNPTYSGLDRTVFTRRVNRKGHAKVELSLMNFVTQNPDWKPPPESEELIKTIRDLWSKELQQVIEQQHMTSSEAFGPLNLNLLTSLTRSVRQANQKSQTPPPSPNASTVRPSSNRQQTQSSMMVSNLGGFTDSAAAALSASSMLKSMQQNSFIQTSTGRYFNSAIPPNTQGILLFR